MNGKFARILLKIIMGIWALTAIYPLFWVMLNSVKPTAAIVTGASFGLPKIWRLANYTEALFEHHVLRYFLNSLLITSATIILTVIVSTMLAYSLSRMIWKNKHLVLSFVMIGIFLPSQVVLVPVFILIRQMHMVNNPLALILTVTSFNIALSTMIAYGFLRSIPAAVEEAAVIDGCGIWGILFRVIIPIIKPAIATMCINVFLQSWNEFMFALVLISNELYKTLPIGLMSYVGQYGTDFGGMFAAMVISSVIPVAVYVLFSNQVEQALTAGAILK